MREITSMHIENLCYQLYLPIHCSDYLPIYLPIKILFLFSSLFFQLYDKWSKINVNVVLRMEKVYISQADNLFLVSTYTWAISSNLMEEHLKNCNNLKH